MKLTGHLTPSVFKRYAIVDEVMLTEGVEKLARLHETIQGSERRSLPFSERSKGDNWGTSAANMRYAAGGGDG